MSCPICGGGSAQDYRPFCSRRCADIDLAKWMNGAYAVPSRDPEDIENALEEADHALRSKENDPKPRHS